MFGEIKSLFVPSHFFLLKFLIVFFFSDLTCFHGNPESHQQRITGLYNAIIVCFYFDVVCCTITIIYGIGLIKKIEAHFIFLSLTQTILIIVKKIVF